MASSRGTSESQIEQPASVVRTFLTADVRGYTRFTQELGDEAAARLAVKFAAVARDVVSGFGGEVVELRGDEALVIFASARQALRAAVELQKRFLSETELDPSLPLRVGIGLDSGEVVPVESGYRGGTLNLAARLSSLAGPGEVLASDTAVHLARKIAGLAYLERGLAELKGFAEPVPVIRVVEENAASSAEGVLTAPTTGNGHVDGNGKSGSAPLMTHDSPLPIGGFLGALPEGLLVGREEEFDRMLAAIKSVESGSGRLVLLSGEPGVGKTRLAQEVTLKARNHSFVMATGRCYEPESAVPFYPFLEALATLHVAAPAPISGRTARAFPDVMRLLPNHGASHGLTLAEGREERQRLFWAVTGFVQAIASERPVALLLDDLHWADGSSLELLQHLARHTRASRVLLLGTYRDVEVSRRHPLEAALRDLGRERLVEEIEIRRFSETGTRDLISATLGGSEVAKELAHIVYHHTEGNPFFVEEVVRSLAERGDIQLKDGRWEGKSLADIEVPRSVRSVIGQRLSRLAEESQEVLREASVLGPAFNFPDLLGMCGRSESDLESALEDAVSAGLMRETGLDSYAFNHALTQGALYAELPSRRRRRLHLAAGTAIEKLPESERQGRAGELAWHFLEADAPERALPYALAAGRSARDIFAFEEAQRHYRTALELARELGATREEVSALEGLGVVLRTLARYEEALSTLDALLTVQRRLGDGAGERWTIAHIGRVHALQGTPGEGIKRVLAALEGVDDEDAGGELPTRSGVAALYTALANLYQATDQNTKMLEAAEQALELARADEDSKLGARLQAEGQMWRAAALAELGDLEDARRMLEEVIPQAEKTGDRLVLSRSLNSLAAVYSEAGQYDRERTYVERALEAAKKTGDPSRVALMQHRLGWHLLTRGYWKEAEPVLRSALATWRSLGYPTPSPWTVVAVAHLALLRGDRAQGEELLQQSAQLLARPAQDAQLQYMAHWVEMDWRMREGRIEDAAEYASLAGIAPDAPQPDNDWLKSFLLPVRAWLALELGDLTRAADLSNEATEMATAESNRTILVEALRVQGLVWAREGGVDEAEQAFAESIATARTIQQPYAEARSLETHGQTLLDRGELATGTIELEQARGIYEALGAIPEATRADELLELAASGETGGFNQLPPPSATRPPRSPRQAHRPRRRRTSPEPRV